jgi:hypothetical protein
VAAPNGTSQVYHTETGTLPFPIDPKLIQVLVKFLVATVRFDVP